MSSISLIDRIINNSIPITESGCWIWLKATDKDGYGFIKVNRKQMRTHRVSHEIFNEEIPTGMMVCHKCDTPSCINPNHLFVGTATDNGQDYSNKKTHCKRGHLKNIENIYYEKSNKAKHCRVCTKERMRRIRDKIRIRTFRERQHVCHQ